MQQPLMIIDATGEGESDPRYDAVLQEVIARCLGLQLEEVRAQWVAVGLVGGMEGISPEVVWREVMALQTHAPHLAGLQPVIIFREYPEEAGAVPVAANCSFACRVQALTGREPHIIGVVQTEEASLWEEVSSSSPEGTPQKRVGVQLGGGWRVDYSFPPEGRAA